MSYPKNRRPKGRPNKDLLYEEYIVKNKTAKEISVLFNSTTLTVKTWLHELNIKKPLNYSGRNKKQYQTEEYLKKEYVENLKFTKQIAEENNVSVSTIESYMRKYKIPYRNHIQTRKLEEFDIEDMYIDKKMSSVEIGKMFNCSHRCVLGELKKRDIQPRELSESQFVWQKKDPNPNLFNKEWLIEEYVVNKKGAVEIGNQLGHSNRTISRALKKYNIHIRGKSESKIGLLKGKRHHNWKGGVCSLNQLLREYFRTNIAPKALKRDERTCKLCGKIKQIMHIHHIYPFAKIVKDIIKENSEYDIEKTEDKLKLYDIIVADKRFWDINNLETYCKYCHLFEVHGLKRSDKVKENKIITPHFKIEIKGISKEDLSHYKDFSLVVHMKSCDFKCCKEANIPFESCINCGMNDMPIKKVYNFEIIKAFDENPLHTALVYAGMESLLQTDELVESIRLFRKRHTKQPVIVYTGYNITEEPVVKFIKMCKDNNLKNIILKVGRYVPNQSPHKDPILGVDLASPNQYAIKIDDIKEY